MRLWNRSPDLRFESLFPQTAIPKKKKFVTLHAPAVAAVIAILGKTAFVIAGYAVTWGAIVKAVLVIAFSIYAYASGSKKGKSGRSALQNIDESGQLINTRETSEPVKIVYGKTKVGGNWVFADQSVDNANLLNVVVTWSEGECDGIANAIDWLPIFTGTGYNDLHTGGEIDDIPGASCTCNELCYEYTGCTCNMTCHGESCDCNIACYGQDITCTCDQIFYSCNSCYTTCYYDGGWGGE